MAKEMTPEEAIRWGIENNRELTNIRYSIEDLKHNLKILSAAEAFQVDFNIKPIWHFGGSSGGYSIEMEENRFAPSAEASLTATKVLMPDLNLSTQVTWESERLGQDFFDSLVNEINANIKLDKKLYPDTWTEREKQVYSIENSLKMKLEELRWTEMEKQIEFIQHYLNIVRLQEQVEIARKQVKLAEEELSRVKKQIALGEGGYQQETAAMIALEEAKNQLFNREQNLVRAKKQWELLLNLPEETIVQFVEDADFIKMLFSQMENVTMDNSPDDLIEQALSENYQVKNSELEKEELLKELQWARDAGKPAVNLSGGYNYPKDNWFIMLDFSVNLADGGAQELKEKQKEDTVQRKDVSIDYLINRLRLEAEQLIDQDQYNQLFLATQLLALEKEQNKVKIMEQQYQQGAISLAQFNNSMITLKDKELNMKQAQDQWLVDRLKLAHFMGFLQEEL